MNIEVAENHTTGNRNKISIQKIYPVFKEKLDLNNNNAILGISINSPASHWKKIQAIFYYLHSLGLEKITCFIGAHLYRYTAMIQFNCTEEEGKNLGLSEFNLLKEEYALLLNQSDKIQLNLLNSAEIEALPLFSEIHSQLHELYYMNNQFKNTVLSFANTYFERLTFSTKENIDHNKFLHCACHYLLEELAVFAVLHKQGFNHLIYPGTIQTIVDIIIMEHPYIKYLFDNYYFVSLGISRR